MPAYSISLEVTAENDADAHRLAELLVKAGNDAVSTTKFALEDVVQWKDTRYAVHVPKPEPVAKAE